MHELEVATPSAGCTADLAPRLLRSSSKSEPTQQVTSVGGPEQTGVTWMSKQKATAIGHFTKLTHRAAHVRAATDNDAKADPAESSQTLHAIQTPTDTPTIGGNADSLVTDAPPEPSTFAKKIQDMLSTFPSLSPGMGPGLSLPSLSAPPQTEADDTPSPVRDPRLHPPLTPSNSENGASEHGWQSLWSALDRLRSPYGKKTELASTPEPSQDQVLDCVDDNNTIMMYGPLEPDDTSEVEIACSEIVSINGDGEEIRTPQPRFIPLPSESFEEVVVGSPGRSPLSRFVPLPFESIGQVLSGGGLSPLPRFSPLPLQSIDRALTGSGSRSPQPRFSPLPLESIDRVLASGGGASSVRESELVSEATVAQFSPAAETASHSPPVKEYRVWLPSLTKISVQTMWWGFRM